MKKTLFVFLLFLTWTGQSQTKVVFEEKSVLKKNPKLEKAQAYAPNKTVIVFTKGYWGDMVDIVIGEKVIPKSAVTVPQLGFATLQIVPNNADIKIRFKDGSNQEITLNKADLQKYKYVYIAKESTMEHPKIEVVYSNETKYAF